VGRLRIEDGQEFGNRNPKQIPTGTKGKMGKSEQKFHRSLRTISTVVVQSSGAATKARIRQKNGGKKICKPRIMGNRRISREKAQNSQRKKHPTSLAGKVHRSRRTIWTIAVQSSGAATKGRIDKIMEDKIMGRGEAEAGNFNHGLRGFSRMGTRH
jgi:hypothetical protein